ncbi:MAG: endopeptidase La [Clostridiales bacterium]|nr:endopeptidase La [Clostridiales bacterium]
MTEMDKISRTPMLALRGISAFPDMLLSFDVERQISIAALDAAMDADRSIFLLAQRDINVDDPEVEDLYIIGTVCFIKQILRMPGGSIRVMVEGKHRARLVRVFSKYPYFDVEIAKIVEVEPARSSDHAEALIRQTHALLRRYAELAPSVSPELLATVMELDNVGYIADYIAQNIYIKHSKKQGILDEPRPLKRIEKLNGILLNEIEILEIELQLRKKTSDRMMKNQREHILREQLKTIQYELGLVGGDDGYSEIDEYREKILKLKAPAEVEEKLLKEVQRLAKQPYSSSEASVIRSYLDTCISLPWNTVTKDRVDVAQTRRILDADHYGLEKVKQRIVEFVAVRQYAPETKGGILCLIGPPGTGKTSIGMSIAKALGRKMARISLGGVHDEAEIRGHRKTYVGAMPGRIITAVAQAGSRNPLLLLDEIDKLGSDYRGDPAAALLEALDPEQNSTFRDHYLELPFDLSDTIFITTANTKSTIPRPLLDRMEVIELTSYTDEEKVQIAKKHLLPKQRKKHGLKSNQLKISDTVIREVISGYTKESGVRTLERELANICRKAVLKFVEEDRKSLTVRSTMLEEFLGPKKYKNEGVRKTDEVGLVRGLAWTSVGGEVLDVEVNVMDGSGKLELTGNLGDVMKESARAGISYIRSRARQLNIDPEFYKKKDIHIHFPEGAVPKDGPSAGITVTLAVISALTGAPVRSDIAMTGEITLRGRILPIGGLKEKTMAALRSGIKTVIIPKENESDLEEIDPLVRNALNFVTTDHIDNILDFALDMKAITPISKDCAKSPAVVPETSGQEENRAILQ